MTRAESRMRNEGRMDQTDRNRANRTKRRTKIMAQTYQGTWRRVGAKVGQNTREGVL